MSIGVATLSQSLEFALNGNYNVFRGTLVGVRYSSQVMIYGDGRLLYTSPMLSSLSIPVEFNVDVSNVLSVKIVIEGASGEIRTTTGIVDARFLRN